MNEREKDDLLHQIDQLELKIMSLGTCFKCGSRNIDGKNNDWFACRVCGTGRFYKDWYYYKYHKPEPEQEMDNEPRIDWEMKALSKEIHRTIWEKYHPYIYDSEHKVWFHDEDFREILGKVFALMKKLNGDC